MTTRLQACSLIFVLSYVCKRTDDFSALHHYIRMLHEFIKANRELLLSRGAKLSSESGQHTDRQIASLGHISVFFDQLIEALRVEHGTPNESNQTSEKSTSPAPAVQLSKSALGHGEELRKSNLTIDEVVRNYGNICQAVTGYAVEVDANIDPAEFRTLNWCLDEAIAQAVVAYTAPARPGPRSIKTVQLEHDARLDDLAMMAGHIDRMSNAVSAIRTGRVGVDGATAALLEKSLNAMRDLVDKGVDQRF